MTYTFWVTREKSKSNRGDQMAEYGSFRRSYVFGKKFTLVIQQRKDLAKDGRALR